jgi:hypothetical protein
LFCFQEAEAEELKAQKKEIEDIAQPIIAKLYQVQISVASFNIIVYLIEVSGEFPRWHSIEANYSYLVSMVFQHYLSMLHPPPS